MSSPKKGNSSQGEPLLFKLSDIPRYLKTYLSDVIDLQKGVDAQATIADIKKNSSLAGANAWMLMCSIVIASIGLSQNSQALIIGAMLISPLMSPILGIGVSIGINDMATLRNSLSHFAIAILIAVLTSYIYFELTPFDEITSEISARTKPTFLDIFVAIFGGFAGIISIARKDVSTTLPGVAIATALMPPLCVTGFGLAHGEWETASAAFYLFFLNTFFVALSTYLIVRYLDFPYRHYLNLKKERLNITLIIASSLALMIPSFLIFTNVLKDHRLNTNLSTFKKQCLQENEIYLDSYHHEVSKETGHLTLFLKVYGDVISDEQVPGYEQCLAGLGVEDFSIKVISTSEVKLDDVELIEESLQTITAELEKSQKERTTNDQLIAYYKESHIDSMVFDQIRDEIKALYSDIENFGLANIHHTNFSNTSHDLPTVMINWKRGTSAYDEHNKRLTSYLKERLDVDSIYLINY